MYLAKPYPEIPVPMQDFDTRIQVKCLRKVLETITDPRRRQILITTIEHADAEGSGRYEALIATCSKKHQSYLYWGSGNSSAHETPQSFAALEVYYRA